MKNRFMQENTLRVYAPPWPNWTTARWFFGGPRDICQKTRVTVYLLSSSLLLLYVLCWCVLAGVTLFCPQDSYKSIFEFAYPYRVCNTLFSGTFYNKCFKSFQTAGHPYHYLIIPRVVFVIKSYFFFFENTVLPKRDIIFKALFCKLRYVPWLNIYFK